MVAWKTSRAADAALPKSVETNLDAADMSVRATTAGPQGLCWFPGQENQHWQECLATCGVKWSRVICEALLR